MALSKKARAELRMKFGGRCAYCGVELPEKGWNADHVAPVIRKNKFVYGKGYVATGEMCIPSRDSIDNLFPTCRRCNSRKHTFSLEGFRREIELQAERLRRYSNSFRLAEDFGIVTDNKIKVVFWFEKFNSSLDRLKMPPRRKQA